MLRSTWKHKSPRALRSTWTHRKPYYFPWKYSVQCDNNAIALYHFIVMLSQLVLTHWGRVTHICVGKLTIIGSDNGLSSERRQAIIWTNAGILLIGPLGTNFSEILIEIQTFSLKKMRLKMSSAKCCSFRLGLNVLKNISHTVLYIRCSVHTSLSSQISHEISNFSQFDTVVSLYDIPLSES